jgi:anion-transporting  ArsA/GET3 family ATPase
MSAPPDASILDRRLVFVTGKGGVGKTSVSAALASLAAERGKRTLVCEMDAKGSLAAAFDVGSLAFQPRQLEPNLFAMAMNTEDALKEYLRLFAKVPFIGRIGPLARTFDFLADAAPGVREILVIGKVCYEVRERNYDLVIVDAEATGHIISQIGAPMTIREMAQVGMVRDQTDWMVKVLHDPSITGVAVVTTPEEMPVTETLALLERLEQETGVAPTTLIANRVLPDLFTEPQRDVVGRLDEALPLIVDQIGPGGKAVLEAATITDARRKIGEGHLDRLRTESDLPMLTVPELFTKATGRRVVALVADALEGEVH